MDLELEPPAGAVFSPPHGQVATPSDATKADTEIETEGKEVVEENTEQNDPVSEEQETTEQTEGIVSEETEPEQIETEETEGTEGFTGESTTEDEVAPPDNIENTESDVIEPEIEPDISNESIEVGSSDEEYSEEKDVEVEEETGDSDGTEVSETEGDFSE